MALISPPRLPKPAITQLPMYTPSNCISITG
jgi:hypothetical protein